MTEQAITSRRLCSVHEEDSYTLWRECYAPVGQDTGRRTASEVSDSCLAHRVGMTESTVSSAHRGPV